VLHTTTIHEYLGRNSVEWNNTPARRKPSESEHHGDGLG
jgi:hypothetical protein